jgi:septal ring factor EnvC (AmiA/AmiB activator)
MAPTGEAQAHRPEQNQEVRVLARIAVLETNVTHIKASLAEMKTDIRELRGGIAAANRAIADLKNEVTKQGAELRRELAQQRGKSKGDIAEWCTDRR